MFKTLSKIVITGLFLCTLLLTGACSLQKEKMNSMDRNEFWEIVGEAKQKSGTNLDVRLSLIKKRLAKYEAEDILKFGKILGAYIGKAQENYMVWAACKVMEGYASDDTFLYYCCWLVSMGEEVYTAAVKDPETLATTEDYEVREFEMIMYVPYELYEKKTGNMPDMEPLSDAEMEALFAGIEFADDTPMLESEEKAKSLIPELLLKLVERFDYDHEDTMEEMRLLREDPEALLQKLKQEALDAGISEEEYDLIMKMAQLKQTAIDG